MQIAQIKAYNGSNNFKQISTPVSERTYQPQFTSINPAKAKNTGLYDKLTDWIAKNYYERFYRSKTAKYILEHTNGEKWNNMTTHMSALGSTLISGMYVVRTLENDKLDPEKRKTLAINDVLTWGVSTACAYFLDSKLAKWWDGVTTRFAANYLLDNKAARRPDDLGDWEAKDLKYMMENWYKHLKTDLAENHDLAKLEKKAYSNIRDFNLDVLKDKKLTTLIDGMGVLKSLFVFGMVYRYLVPVLVMKPANMIGQHLHEKKAHNLEQNAQKVDDKSQKVAKKD